MPRKKRPTAARKTAGRKPMVRTGPAGGLSSALRGVQSYHMELLAQRRALDAQIGAVENALAVMGRPAAPAQRAAGRPGRPPGRPPGGAPRPGSLKSYLVDVLSGQGVMTVKDITSAVLAAGYKTKNKTLAKSVGIALTELKGVTKVGRGRFRLKK